MKMFKTPFPIQMVFRGWRRRWRRVIINKMIIKFNGVLDKVQMSWTHAENVSMNPIGSSELVAVADVLITMLFTFISRSIIASPRISTGGNLTACHPFDFSTFIMFERNLVGDAKEAEVFFFCAFVSMVHLMQPFFSRTPSLYRFIRAEKTIGTICHHRRTVTSVTAAHIEC